MNWAFKYDAEGTIDNLWNAAVHDYQGEDYIIKNSGWNYEIAPSQSVNFGYTLVNNEFTTPSNFVLCSKRVEMPSGYEVNLNVADQWDTGIKAELTITNSSDKPLEAWTVSFDSNFTIDDLWDGRILESTDNRYTVVSEMWTNPIAAGASKTIGFTASIAEDIMPEISNCVLTDVEIEAFSAAPEFDSDDEPNGFQDIGTVYFKEPTWDDVVVDDSTGMQYIKNQLLISAFPGVPIEAIEKISAEVGAAIVGYIEMTNDYQIEFGAEKTLTELATAANYLNSFSFISNVTLNFYDDVDVSKITNDTLYNDDLQVETVYRKEIIDGKPKNVAYTIFHDGKTDGTDTKDYWNEMSPNGNNWGLEAIHALSAWDCESEFNTVKVGVFDAGFGEHEDLDYAAIIENEKVSDHGTHVCGTIAAKHNNNYGISGVATDVKLYACTGGDYPGSLMGEKIILLKLIANHVKVINVSMGYSNVSMTYAASQSEFPDFQRKAQEFISAMADGLSEYLKKLLMMGYDFVICASAGNADNTTFIVDSSQTYGFRTPYEGESTISLDTRCGNVLAKWNYSLTAITDAEVKNHIIVVGALELNGSGGYQKASFSNYGDRIDVMAPGVNILSTVPVSVQNPDGYQLMSGTSMACPHVTGTVAMMYQVNSELSGTDVKQMLIDNADFAFSLPDPADTSSSPSNIDYVIPNASRACDSAKAVTDAEVNDITWPSGVICGYTKNILGNALGHVQFSALKKSTGEYNVGVYGIGQHDYTFESDDNGYYVQTLPQGLYDILVSKDGYMPYLIRNIVIRPNETNYMETINLGDWFSFFDGTIFYAVQGNVINALSGQPIKDANVNLRKGWNNKTGAYVKNIFGQTRTGKSNASGDFAIFAPYGSYTAEIVKDGFVVGYFNLISYREDWLLTILDVTPTMPLTPVLADGEYRIVLTWGDTPSDLDSHLTYYEGFNQKFHVYYRSKKGYIGGIEVANLDLDDTSSYGPETVTLTLNTSQMKENSQFRYSVHNYSDGGSTNSRRLSLSNATVRVYYGDNMEIFHVPSNKIGNVWHVFDITKSGIQPVTDDFYNSSASSVR